MCVEGGVKGERGDAVAHSLTVLKTPAPNTLRDPLRLHTICVEMKHMQLTTAVRSTSCIGAIDMSSTNIAQE